MGFWQKISKIIKQINNNVTLISKHAFACSTTQNQSRPMHQTTKITTKQNYSKESDLSKPYLSENALIKQFPYPLKCSLERVLHSPPLFIM